MSNPLPDALAEGRFKLLEVIGEGGMATVYRAFDARLQRPRAIKVLSPALAGRPQLRKRFLSEAQTMATLEESRVVRVFDMGEDGERCFIVMELVEGGSLLDRVRDYGPLPPRMAADVVIQICESLQAAHDAGVIHRDIKPHNVLLTRTGEIRVTYFGIAQVQQEGGDGMTKTGAVMGTWGFMAPEQKSNAKQVDARADIYSVGATLWALLLADTPPELFVADAEPEMLEGVPDELAEVIKRATRYRREERYPSARVMAESLRALIKLLPPDPEISIPLVPASESRTSLPKVDTLAQFKTSQPPDDHHTMGPDFGGTIAPADDRHGSGTPRNTMAPVDAWVARGPAEGTEEVYLAESLPAPRRTPLLVGGAVVVLLLLASGGWLATHRDPPAATPSRTEAAVAPPVAVPAVPPVVEPTVSPVPVPAAAVQVAPPVVASDAVAPAKAAPAKPPRTPPRSETSNAVPPTQAAAVAPAIVTDALTHSPPGAAAVGDTVSFRASIAGDYTMKLYYRGVGTTAFQEKMMPGSGGSYAATVKVTDAMASGIEYFISASGIDTVKEGSAMRPLKVKVGG